MEYSVEKLSDLEIVKITVNGTLNRSEKKEIYSKAFSELNINAYHRLLLDISSTTVSQEYTSGDMLNMANYIKKFELQKSLKLAFFDTDNKGNHETFRTFINIIIPIEISSFSSYDKAIKWLC
jgi:hypothetical protein